MFFRSSVCVCRANHRGRTTNKSFAVIYGMGISTSYGIATISCANMGGSMRYHKGRGDPSSTNLGFLGMVIYTSIHRTRKISAKKRRKGLVGVVLVVAW